MAGNKTRIRTKKQIRHPRGIYTKLGCSLKSKKSYNWCDNQSAWLILNRKPSPSLILTLSQRRCIAPWKISLPLQGISGTRRGKKKARCQRGKSFKSANKHCDSYNAGSCKVGGGLLDGKHQPPRLNEMYSLLTFDSASEAGNKRIYIGDVDDCKVSPVSPHLGEQPGATEVSSSLCCTKPCSDFAEGKLFAFHLSSLFVCLLVSFRVASFRSVFAFVSLLADCVSCYKATRYPLPSCSPARQKTIRAPSARPHTTPPRTVLSWRINLP